MQASLTDFKPTTARKILFLQYAIIILEVFVILYRASGINLFGDHALHSFWMNVFMVNYTFIGDGWFALFLVGYLIYKKKPIWKELLFTVLFSLLIIQVLKNALTGFPMQLFFEDGQYLLSSLSAGISEQPHLPSGHTAMAFMLAGFASSRFKNTRWIILLAAGATLLAVSRLYLSNQGFTGISTGALLGGFSLLVSPFLYSTVGSAIQKIRAGFRNGFYPPATMVTNPGNPDINHIPA